MIVDLPYPHKALWPNGRAHWAAKAREVKKHRHWAYVAARAAKPIYTGDTPIAVSLTVHGKPRGVMPDKDNCIAAMKAYQDGIADALGIDDARFLAPTVSFASKRASRFVIEVAL